MTGSTRWHSAGWWQAVAGILTAVGVIIGLLAWLVPRGSGAADSAPSPSSPASVTTSTPTTAPTGPLVVRSTWPTTRGCDGGTAVAMPAGNTTQIDAYPAGAADVRQQITAAGGGSWRRGHLYLDLAARDDKAIDIVNIVPRVSPPNKDQPSWVYAPGGGCGGASDRVFRLDLDGKRLTDEGVSEGTDSADPSATAVRSEPLGSTFSVSRTRDALIRFDSLSCDANYTWSLEIRYSVEGDEQVYSRVVGPFRSYGIGGSAPVYDSESADGQAWHMTKYGTAASIMSDTDCKH